MIKCKLPLLLAEKRLKVADAVRAVGQRVLVGLRAGSRDRVALIVDRDDVGEVGGDTEDGVEEVGLLAGLSSTGVSRSRSLYHPDTRTVTGRQAVRVSSRRQQQLLPPLFLLLPCPSPLVSPLDLPSSPPASSSSSFVLSSCLAHRAAPP